MKKFVIQYQCDICGKILDSNGHFKIIDMNRESGMYDEESENSLTKDICQECLQKVVKGYDEAKEIKAGYQSVINDLKEKNESLLDEVHSLSDDNLILERHLDETYKENEKLIKDIEEFRIKKSDKGREKSLSQLKEIEDRPRLIALYNAGWDVEKLADEFGVTKNRVNVTIKELIASGRLEKRVARRGRPKK